MEIIFPSELEYISILPGTLAMIRPSRMHSSGTPKLSQMAMAASAFDTLNSPGTPRRYSLTFPCDRTENTVYSPSFLTLNPQQSVSSSFSENVISEPASFAASRILSIWSLSRFTTAFSH